MEQEQADRKATDYREGYLDGWRGRPVKRSGTFDYITGHRYGRDDSFMQRECQPDYRPEWRR
jgi:hypothetical protein